MVMNAERLARHQILLYEGDFARLENIYTTKKPTQVIRELVRRHCEQVEAKLREQANHG